MPKNIFRFSPFPSPMISNGGSCCEKTDVSTSLCGGFRLWADVDAALSALFQGSPKMLKYTLLHALCFLNALTYLNMRKPMLKCILTQYISQMSNYLPAVITSLTTLSPFLGRILGRCIIIVPSWCFLFLLFCPYSNLSSILTGYL